MSKKDDALKLALPVIEDYERRFYGGCNSSAGNAVREALAEQPAQQQERLTDSQIMASIGRHWGGEKTSISQSRPVGQQWEQICELVRCVIRERYTSPPAQQQEPVAFITPLMEQQMFDDWCPYKGNPDPRTVWAAAIEAVNGLLLGASPAASKPLPEDYTALEQALTRLQKRYADLEGRASKPLTDEQITAGARALCKRMAEACCVNVRDQWQLYADSFKKDAKAVLEAAAKLREKNA